MKKIKEFVLFNAPLFMGGWWVYTMFISKKVDMTDGWVTLGALFLIWIFASDESIKD